MREKYLYYSIIVSALLYACYRGTNDFYWRVISLPFTACFYALSFVIVKEKWQLIKFQFRKTNLKLLFLFILLIILFLPFSFRFDLSSISTLLFHPSAFLAFYIAFVSLTITRIDIIRELKKIFDRISSIFLLITCFDYLFFKKPILTNELYLFLIFSLIFSNKKRWKWNIYLTVLLTGIVAVNVLLDNRIIAIRVAMVVGVIFLLSLINFRISNFLKISFIIISVIVLYTMTFQFDAIFDFAIGSSMFDNLNQTNSRSFLFEEVFESLKGSEWLWGRGYLGEYHSEWFSNWQGDYGDNENRFAVEVGVLNLLLKGGGIFLLSHIIILISAVNKGLLQIYRSKIAFKISIFLLIQFLLLGVGNRSAFDINNLFIWLSVGIIYYLSNLQRKLNGNKNKRIVNGS